MIPVKAVRLLFILLVFFAVSAGAADMSGKLGLGFLASQSSQSLMVRYWLSESFTLEPQIGFSSVSVDDNTATTFLPGFGLSYYGCPGKVARPFFGIRFLAGILSANEESYTDFSISPALGGEYFFSESFSVSGEFQVNFIFTDKNYSPGTGINDATIIQTAQFLGMNIYF